MTSDFVRDDEGHGNAPPSSGEAKPALFAFLHRWLARRREYRLKREFGTWGET